MTSHSAAFSFGVLSEARGDQQIVSELAERVFIDEVDWVERENVADVCQWRGLDPNTGHLEWRRVLAEAKRRRIVAHGRFRSARGAFDERRARLALLLFTSLDPLPDSVVLVRDTDCEEERLASLRKVREEGRWKFPVVLATPHPKRECWVLAGFDPRNAKEEAKLAELRSELGFDPRLEAHRLTAGGTKGKRNAKKALAKLMAPGSSREESCWHETELAVLKKRGNGSMLADYLEEVSEGLTPLMSGMGRGKSLL